MCVVLKLKYSANNAAGHATATPTEPSGASPATPTDLFLSSGKYASVLFFPDSQRENQDSAF